MTKTSLVLAKYICFEDKCSTREKRWEGKKEGEEKRGKREMLKVLFIPNSTSVVISDLDLPADANAL